MASCFPCMACNRCPAKCTCRRPEAAERALKLLDADRGVTWRYAAAAVVAEMVDPEDLRGHGPRGRRRFYLA